MKESLNGHRIVKLFTSAFICIGCEFVTTKIILGYRNKINATLFNNCKNIDLFLIFFMTDRVALHHVSECCVVRCITLASVV